MERSLGKAREGRTRLTLAFAKGRVSEDACTEAMDALEVEVKDLTKRLDDARSAVVLAPKDDAERQDRIVWLATALRDLPPSEACTRLRREMTAIKVSRLPGWEAKPFMRLQGGIEIIWR